MSGSSDPLLISKKAARIIKGLNPIPGSLSVTQTRLIWQPNTFDKNKPGDGRSEAQTVKSVSIFLTNITKQQQAPGKPMLRILSSAAEPLALSFESDADKNDVLEVIKQSRPASGGFSLAGGDGGRGGGMSEEGFLTDAQKRKIFAFDKDLATLYTHLVPSGIILENEFWQSHKKDVARLLGKSGGKTKEVQRSGLSSVMHEVERMHDGTTERVSIQLTPEDIEKIFFERPEVHRAFLAHVPHSLSESDFWKSYFKLEYKKAAKRKRLAAQGRLDVTDADLEDSDDIFAPFRRQIAEETAEKSRKLVRRVDPTVNLLAEYGDRYTESISGLYPMTSEKGDSYAGGVPITNLESIAHDINRHGAQVLEGPPEGIMITGKYSNGGGNSGTYKAKEHDADGPKDSISIAARVAESLNKAQTKRGEHSKNGKTEEQQTLYRNECSKIWKDRATSGLEDLTLEEKPNYEPLRISDPRSYFASKSMALGRNGATPLDQMNEEKLISNILVSLRMVNVESLRIPPCNPAHAMEATLDAFKEDDFGLTEEFGPSASTALLKDPRKELTGVMLEYFRLEALRTNEILRHFWACMPPVTDSRKAKASRLVIHLEKLKTELSAHCTSASNTLDRKTKGVDKRESPVSLSVIQQVLIAQIVRPLLESINSALRRYADADHA